MISEKKNEPEWMTYVADLHRRGKHNISVLTPEEQQWLAEVQPAIEEMEQDPHEFSMFQTAMIREIVESLDPNRLEQIRGIIEKTYAQANQEGLDLLSKPDTGTEDWVARRHQLDRKGTQIRAVLFIGSYRTL